MNLKENCCLCGIAQGKRKLGNSDTPFIESDTFFAIPSIGAFIEGWTMVVPKKHVLSMKDSFIEPSFDPFLSEVIAHVEEAYGTAVLFEHGAQFSGSLTGCGVDHAHLHIVPFQGAFREELLGSEQHWQKCSRDQLACVVGKSEYLYFEDQSGGLLHIVDSPRSQYFRNVLAKLTGNEDKADYKRFPLKDSSDKTFLNLVR